MLRAEYGWEGYGIFWALIEMMFDSSDTCLHHDKIKGIAAGNNIDISILQDVIKTCISQNLFVSDDNVFWSESLRRRKEKYMNIKTAKSKGGKKAMAKRWAGSDSHKTLISNLQDSDKKDITENNKGKEKKVKEKKVKENKVYTQIFENAYKIYPRPQAKQDTFNNWNKLLDNYTEEQLYQFAVNYSEYYKSIPDSEQGFAYSSNNFYGQKAYYIDFKEPKKWTGGQQGKKAAQSGNFKQRDISDIDDDKFYANT